MKNNKKVSLVGFVALPTAIISGLILDLILERDLLEGLIFSISFGLVFSITWMVITTIRNRKKENRILL
jgi:Na+-translocating ferredoxin:NAD+ oxidoreductase RnfA subunit